MDVVLMSKGQFTQRRRDVKREEVGADIALSPDLLPPMSCAGSKCSPRVFFGGPQVQPGTSPWRAVSTARTRVQPYSFAIS